jgi:hypothetical protein
MSVLRERVTWVWLGLMVLTCVTTWGLAPRVCTLPYQSGQASSG